MFSGLIKLTLLVLCCSTFVAVTDAQSGSGGSLIFEVKFAKGVFAHTGAVSAFRPCSTVGGAECSENHTTNLVLKAKRGERIRITLTSETGDARFSVLGPDLSPLSKSSNTTDWFGTLRFGGEYKIYVFADTGSARYTLTVRKIRPE